MADDSLVVGGRKTFEYFEEIIPIRGCRLSLDEVKGVYRELSAINLKFGEQIVTGLTREEGLNDEQWTKRKAFLLNNGFCLTVTVRGQSDVQLYGETEDIFSSSDLPKPIKTIYFNNITAFARNASGENPINRIEVTLDFGKPALLDPNPLVSEPTANNSTVTINARETTYFRAVQKVVDSKLLNRRTWYSAIHRTFIYDLGMWLLALPIGLFFATNIMEKLLPLGSPFAAYKWAVFIYVLGISLIGYRLLVSYTKWAFPVNVLTDNKDTAWKHRTVLGTAVVWIGYKLVDAVWAIIWP